MEIPPRWFTWPVALSQEAFVSWAFPFSSLLRSRRYFVHAFARRSEVNGYHIIIWPDTRLFHPGSWLVIYLICLRKLVFEMKFLKAIYCCFAIASLGTQFATNTDSDQPTLTAQLNFPPLPVALNSQNHHHLATHTADSLALSASTKSLGTFPLPPASEVVFPGSWPYLLCTQLFQNVLRLVTPGRHFL